MNEPLQDALNAAEIRLKSVRQQIIGLTDAGATDDHVITIRQGDLILWFDRLDLVSSLLRSAERHALPRPDISHNHGTEAYRSLMLDMGRVIRASDDAGEHSELWTQDGDYIIDGRFPR